MPSSSSPNEDLNARTKQPSKSHYAAVIKYAVNGETHVTLQAEQAQVLFMDKHRLTFLNQL